MSERSADEAWRSFISHAAYVLGNPWFDSERARKLAIACELQDALQIARAGADFMTRLERISLDLTHPRWPYDLVLPRDYKWLRKWAAADLPSLGEALGSFLEEEPAEQRFARLCQAAPRPHRGALLTWGSLLNFAVEPRSLPVVSDFAFRNAEEHLCVNAPEGSPLDEYRRHLSFARQVEERLRSAGVAVRDALDVQALIHLSFHQAEFWSHPRDEGPAGDSRPGEALRETPRDGRPYVAICACLGYASPYLLEWVELHRLVGVERFFLYNNRDRDAQRELLEPYVAAGVVVLHDWPAFPPQVGAFRHCLDEHREHARWIAFQDTDEFLFSPSGNPLPQALTGYERWPGVCVNRATFGSGGHRTRPEGLVVENYTTRIPIRADRDVKSIVDPARVVDCLDPHHFLYKDGLPVDENCYPVIGPMTSYVSLSRLRINHYYTKSEEEFQVKSARSRADDASPYPEPDFDARRRFERELGEPDRAILRYLPALHRALEEGSGKQLRS